MEFLQTLFGEPILTRKFVDSIYRLTSKYPAVDPSVNSVAVGDYGTLDPKTGVWIREGSIFDRGFGRGFVFGTQVLEGEVESEFRVCTTNAKTSKVDIAVTGDTPIAGANAGIKYEFIDEGGALILVSHMRCRYLDPARIPALLENDRLEDKVLVNQVWSAPAWVNYVTLKANDSVTISGGAHGPIPVAPGLDVGGSVTFTWNNTHEGGMYREGHNPGATYTPLFSTVKKKGWFRGAPEPGVPQYEEAGPPWLDLDEVGEEIMVGVYDR